MVKVETVPMVSIVSYELEAALKVDSIPAAMEVYELVASFELADDAACLLYFGAWCTTPSLLDSIFVPFSRAISSKTMQAKSAQRTVKRNGDLVANGV